MNCKVTRRQLLKGAAVLGTGTVLAACQQPTPVPPTQAPPPAATVASLPTPSGDECDNHDVFHPLLSQSEKVTLVQWDSCESETISAFYDQLASEFSEVYPNVTMVGQHAQSAENFVAACAAGTAPDMWSGGWNPERMGVWAKNGCLMAIDEFLAETDFPKDRFIPGCWDTVEMDGKTWGLPNGVGVYMLWYNPNHLKEIGTGFPKDMDELWADADKLTKRDAAGDITNLGMKLTTWFWEHLTWICSFGGRIWDVEKNEPTPDHPGVIAALEDLAAAAKRYGIDQLDRWSASIGGQEGVQQPFMTGHLSMMIDGDWYLQQIDEMKKEWTPGADFGVDVAPYAPKSKLQGEPGVSLWVWPHTISSQTKQGRWCWEYQRWSVSRERAIKGASTTRDLISTMCYLRDPRVSWESAKAIVRFIDAGKVGISPLPMTPISGEYSDLIGAAVDEVVHLKISPKDAMARVKQEAGELWAKAQGKS